MDAFIVPLQTSQIFGSFEPKTIFQVLGVYTLPIFWPPIVICPRPIQIGSKQSKNSTKNFTDRASAGTYLFTKKIYYSISEN